MIELVLVAIFALQPQAFQFQSETVEHKDMTRDAVATSLMHIAARSNEALHVIVRFDEPVGQVAKQQLLNNGLLVQGSIGGSAYIAMLDPQRIDSRGIFNAASVLELRSIDPQWKLHGFLAEGNIPTWTMPTHDSPSANPDLTVALYVMFHKDVDLPLAAQDMEAIFRAKIRSTIKTNNTIVMEIPYSVIDILVEDDRVLYIEPALPKFSEHNDSNRDITQANAAQEFPYSLDGDGVVVMVYDGGYGWSGHPDFGGRHTARDNSGQSNHATHVAGTIGGDGTDSGGLYRGMAPGVTIESYGFEQEGGLHEGFLYSDPGDIEQDYGEAINNFGAVLANNSIGTNTAWNGFPCEWTGDYGITSNLIDSVVRGDLGGNIRIIWANGNERGTSNCGSSYHSTAPPACAKNHITVGAYNSNDESMTDFSSWGPTDDGRIKPDISAPGCQSSDDNGVTSCSSFGGYTNMCGTSMACPTVTGLSALIMQDWRLQFPGEPDLRNETLKALLAHTAADKFNLGPDCQYGYGSVRVVNAIDQIRSGNFGELLVSQGETVEMLVFVEDPSELKVTIAWDDVPGEPLVIPSLVNDIDLTVIDPSGTLHYPWTIDPNNPALPAVRNQPDHANNIEQVQIDAADSGVYRILMTGHNIAQGPQTFALMASPLLIQCSSSGIASLDRASYACDAEVVLQVVDCDLNTDDTTIESIDVTLSSSHPNGDDELLVTLVESGEATASFHSSGILLGTDIMAYHASAIQLTYVDADDGQGGIDIDTTDIATVDCESPLITSVAIAEVLTHEATAMITTSEDTSVRINYGTDCIDLSEAANSSSMSTSHEIRLGPLSDNTTYKFEVIVTDAAGNSVTDSNNGSCYSFITADVPDYFTEQFSGGFDLDGFLLTLTPYESIDGYFTCAEPITELPSDPSKGNIVPLSDDDYEAYTLQQPILLYGEPYDQIYIGSNGQITMNNGSTDYTETLSEHFSQPLISMLWDDLNPSSGGTVRYAPLIDRVVVSFVGVPEYSNTGSNTFQCEMFFDGTIRLGWLGIGSNDSIVGLSAGEGQPTGFEQSDLSALNNCGDPPVLGDVNADGIVNVTDLLAIMDAWGPCSDCPEDLNDDGTVNIIDLLEVVGNWG